MMPQTENRRVYIPVGYIHIDDPVAVFGSDQNAPEKKADRGADHPTPRVAFDTFWASRLGIKRN